MGWTWGLSESDPAEARRSLEKCCTQLTALIAELTNYRDGGSPPLVSAGLLRSHRHCLRITAELWEGCGPPEAELQLRSGRAIAGCQHALREWGRQIKRRDLFNPNATGQQIDVGHQSALVRGVLGQLVQLRRALESLADPAAALESYRAGKGAHYGR